MAKKAPSGRAAGVQNSRGAGARALRYGFISAVSARLRSAIRPKPVASRKAFARALRQVMQGLCPAASPTASSRKNSSVQWLAPMIGACCCFHSSAHSTQPSVVQVCLRSVLLASSWRMPRLPVKRPRASTACIRENGSTRFCRGMGQPIAASILGKCRVSGGRPPTRRCYGIASGHQSDQEILERFRPLDKSVERQARL